MLRALYVLFSVVFLFASVGAKDEISAFLESINPGEIYDNPSMVQQLTSELTIIRKAHERRGRGESFYDPGFREKIRGLISEDWSREGIAVDSTDLSVEELLDPHRLKETIDSVTKKLLAVKYKDYSPTDSFFDSLFVISPGGILSEASILIAAACGFWLYGVPEASQEFYEADGSNFQSRLRFINHDGYHRSRIIKNLTKLVAARETFGALKELSALPKRLRKLLSSVRLNQKTVLFLYNTVHEKKWKYLDNKYFSYEHFDSGAALALYNHFFEIPIDSIYFTEKAPLFRACLNFFSRQQIARNKKESVETYCHWMDADLLRALQSGNLSIVSPQRLNQLNLCLFVGNFDLFEKYLAQNPESINHRDKDGLTMLGYVARYMSGENETLYLSMAQRLMDAGLSAYEMSYLSDDKLNTTPVQEACIYKRMSLLELFIAKEGVKETNSAGWSFVHLYVEIEDENLLDLALQHGCAINGKNKPGNTPLCLAAIRQKHKIMDILLKREADPNIPGQKDKLPLILLWKEMRKIEIRKRFSLFYRYQDENSVEVREAFEVMKNLLPKEGINCRDSKGRSMVFWACKKFDLSFLKFLIAHGADLNQRDFEGMYPIELARPRCSTFQDYMLNFICAMIDNGAMIDFEMGLERGATKHRKYYLNYVDGMEFGIYDYEPYCALVAKVVEFLMISPNGPLSNTQIHGAGTEILHNLVRLFVETTKKQWGVEFELLEELYIKLTPGEFLLHIKRCEGEYKRQCKERDRINRENENARRRRQMENALKRFGMKKFFGAAPDNT